MITCFHYARSPPPAGWGVADANRGDGHVAHYFQREIVVAGKRGQNEGSIVKRADGRWCAVLNLGYADGKRKRKYYYGKTRAEVASALAVAKHNQKQGIAPTDGRLTVTAFLTRWLEDKVKPSVAPSTYRSYDDTTKLYIIPAIGRIRLDRLTAVDVQ